MEKISEFIPLLIIILSVLFSFMRGDKKKKKQNTWQKTVPPTQVPVEDAWWETELPVDDVESESFFQEPEKPIMLSKRKGTPKKQSKTSQKNDSDAFVDFSEADELKKAIIYSEILKRPEF